MKLWLVGLATIATRSGNQYSKRLASSLVAPASASASASASFASPRKNATSDASRTVTPSPKKRKSTTAASSLATKTKLAISKDGPLLILPSDCVEGILQSRPSKRNRSPYVADVMLCDESQRVALCHVPNLDMGGKCRPGARLLMKPARDAKGRLVGSEAVNPKYGTPKCEFIAQLLRVEEPGYAQAAWVGAHPSLGEQVAQELIQRNLLGPELPRVESFEREVRHVGGTNMRADFVLTHTDPHLPKRVLEVKTVVDTDYQPGVPVPDGLKCVFYPDASQSREPYQRTAIFPWGQSNQKGPEGEKVVSARAIKHVQELTRLVKRSKVTANSKPTDANKKKDTIDIEPDSDNTPYSATILFVVIRRDAKAFRPNLDACPSFAKHLKQARDAGVQVLAKQVCWGEEHDTIGTCTEGPLLDIIWPSSSEES